MTVSVFGPPLEPMTPAQAVRRSQARLARLQQLFEAPHLTDERRRVIGHLVGAQAAIVIGRENYLKRII